jgi:crotonobetainyl-CoA:carnitine CoA-transferase CaiB-like acyl-CoA transferase
MQPLEGLTVVALEHAIAAPFAPRQLADLAELGVDADEIAVLRAADTI